MFIFALSIISSSYSHIIANTDILSNENNFSAEKLETCAEFNAIYSKYVVTDYIYFFDKQKNYYGIKYDIRDLDPHATSLKPTRILTIGKDVEFYGDFIKCDSDNNLVVKDNIDKIKIKIKDMTFLKPLDSFTQPPELKDSVLVGTVASCSDFNEMLKNNTTGFLIYKSKLGNYFVRQCIWIGCTTNYYDNIPLSQYVSQSHPQPYEFFWNIKFDKNGPTEVYKECKNQHLYFTEYLSSYREVTLPLLNLSFYNIKPQTEDIKKVKIHLVKEINTCNDFNKYLEDPINILNNYIYFAYTDDTRNPEYYALKVKLLGPEINREMSYLLRYKPINEMNCSYAPLYESKLFVKCDKEPISKKDSLFFVLERDHKKTYFIDLSKLKFYDKNYLTEGPVVHYETYSEEDSVIKFNYYLAELVPQSNSHSENKDEIEMKELKKPHETNF